MSHPLSLQYARSSSMVFRRIADDAVLVPIARSAGDMNAIYTINGVGCRVWELLNGQTPLSDILDVIVREFAVERAEAETDLLAFVQQLLEVAAVQETSS